MDMPYLIAIRIHFGGKFEGERRYIGGEVDVLEECDWYSWQFSELFNSYIDRGCSDVQKFAFRVKNTDELMFFKDDTEFRTRIYNCVDVENEKLDVYVGDVELENEDEGYVGLTEGLETYVEDDLEADDQDYVLSSDETDEVDATDDADETNEMSDDSLLENDDVEAVGKMDNQLQYDKDCDHKRLKLQLGMQFKDVEECKSAVKLWAIMNGYNIRWVKSEFDRVKAICEKECPWKLYASTLTREPTCVIKTYVGEHDCVRPLHNRQATSGWIAEQMFEHIKSNPLMRAQEIQLLLRKKYNTRVELLQCYRAKDTALKKLRGTLEEHYAKLRSYISELQKRDTDGNFCVKTYLDNAEKPVFQRVYIGFSALRKGFFIGCRKFLSFDACFLKTTVGGALLAAVSKDCCSFTS
ncbi:uncharacterized protein LOC131018964 [Salvia miltiorrhiza]|uniref:uncharacterized protein LOC131018964 n=1 Tax=Salvia miltiorrhiza TaxID=226208 RepID=UPI0025AD1DE7|nr:uncharacterized protein LOC131018964 [Salvia miltiorrhiza]